MHQPVKTTIRKWRISGIVVSKFRRTEIVIKIKNISEERFRKDLFFVHFLQLLCHEEALERDLVPWPGHAENPGDPLQEQHLNLHQDQQLNKCLEMMLCPFHFVNGTNIQREKLSGKLECFFF